MKNTFRDWAAQAHGLDDCALAWQSGNEWKVEFTRLLAAWRFRRRTGGEIVRTRDETGWIVTCDAEREAD